MATIKSFSDLQQSKKLEEILPLESADMFYFDDNGGDPNFKVRNGMTYYYDSDDCLSCWSLAALLDVLPYCPDLSKHTDGKWYITTYPNDVHTCLMAYDNPIDACYEMVIRLNELKML